MVSHPILQFIKITNSAIMKSYIFIPLVIFTLLSSWACQNSLPIYGSAPVQLHDVQFNIDIPTLLNNDNLFNTNYDESLKLRVDESSFTSPDSDSTIYFLQYNMYSNSKKINLAQYNNHKFKTLELITDIDEKNVLIWMATEDSVSKEDISKLVTQLNADNPDASISSKDLEYTFNDDGLRMVWRGPSRVVKLVIPNLSPIKLEFPQEEQYYEYDDNGYLIDKNEKEHFTKEQLLAEFNKALHEAADKNEIILFISEPKFDKLFSKGSRGTSGTMTSYL